MAITSDSRVAEVTIVEDGKGVFAGATIRNTKSTVISDELAQRPLPTLWIKKPDELT